MAGDDSSSDKATGQQSARPGAPAAPLALYRRYRPATFAELKGQDHVTEPLRQALRSGRVNHAYLFSGPRGCGKTSSARILARSLNCEQGPTPDPCGVCESCVSLAPSGPGSIDVIEIDAASHGGIDDARDLRERAFYSPVAARYKIYIIDEAHMVTGAGFNALLKLVEEPPPHLKFVFATTEPEKVIATIRSRTHHYPFRLVPPAVLRELLEEILGSEGVTYEPAVLPVVIRAGAGSVRDSLSVLDQLIAGADDSGLRYDRAIALLGYTDDALLDEISEAFAARDGAAIFGAIDHVVEGGHDPRRFAMDLLDRLRDLIVLAAVPDAAATGLLDVPEDRLERMRKQAAGFGQDRLVRAAETISSGLVEMRGATSPRLLLELMCAQVLLPAEPAGSLGPADQSGAAGAAGVTGLDDLAARLDRLERRVSAGPAATGSGAATGDAAKAARDSESRARGETPSDTRQTAASQTPPRQPHTEQPQSSQPSQSPRPEPRQPQPQQSHQQQPPSGRAEPQRGVAAQDPGGAGVGASGALDMASLQSRWSDVLEAVRDVRKTAWILLSNYASVDSVEGTVLTLAFDSEGNAKGFGSSGSDSHLADVLESMFGVRPVVRAVMRQSGRGDAPDSRRAGGPAADGADVRAGAGRQPGGGQAAGPSRTEPDRAGSEPGPGRTQPGPDQSQTGASRDRPDPTSTEPDQGRTAIGSGQPGQPDRVGRRAEPAGSDASPAGAHQGDSATREVPGGGHGQRSVTQAKQSVANGATGHDAPPGPHGDPGTNSPGGPRGGASSPGAARRTRAASQHIPDDPRPFTDDTPPDATDGLTGTDLILRELGGRVIEEIGEP